MKRSITSITLLCLISVALTQGPVTVNEYDKTVPDSNKYIDDICVKQILNIKQFWTGDCEGSYAAMTASAIQDNICLTYNIKLGENSPFKNEPLNQLTKIRVSY